jgi:O-methyltransferase involved in polyketide biosynthesis
VTAVARELHREQPRPWVLDDDLAKGLAGEEGVALATRLRAELTMPQLLSFSRWVCVRARWPEDIVEAAVADGFCQYVVLGPVWIRLPTGVVICSTGCECSRLIIRQAKPGNGTG